MDYETLTLLLASLGYKELKKMSSRRIAVLTTENRVAVLENIQKNLKNSKYDTTPSSVSSVGMVKYESYEILAKPAGKQGRASAGTENEDILVDQINKLTETGPINVIFDAPNQSYEIFGCVGARSVGTDTAGRKKADVVLEDYRGKEYPISIKKDNAEVWESADTYFSTEAERIIEKAIKAGVTKLTKQGTFYTIEPNIAVEATQQEKRDVVFGSDISPDGCVVTRTFTSRDFEYKDDLLVIDVSNIITKMTDVKGDKDVFFLIRNDKTRKAIKKYPGIRVLASYKKRINKNIVIVKR